MPYLRCFPQSPTDYIAEIKDELDFDKEFEPRWWRFKLKPDGELCIETELLERLDWQADDLLEWFSVGHTEFLLIKINKS